MSEEPNEIDVYESTRFGKVLGKLREAQQKIVEDEIDKIIENPELGALKKGDLSYLRVHKFNLHEQQVLLGYSWEEDRIQIHLLSLGSHENFYQKMKTQRKGDLKLINS